MDSTATLGSAIFAVVVVAWFVWPSAAAVLVQAATPPGRRHDDLATAATFARVLVGGWVAAAGILVALPFLI